MSDPLIALLIKHEGVRLRPYMDTVGKLTVGVGRNLTDNGISQDEAMMLLVNDIEACRAQMQQAFPWAAFMTPARRDVLTSLIFNIGLGGVKEFKLMLAQLGSCNYADAADELLNSRYARQVGQRAVDLANIMRIGAYPMP